MNIDIIKGKWSEIKGKIKQQWGSLTEDDITVIEGSREQLVGKLQRYYGYNKEKAKEEIDKFLKQNKWDA